MFGKKKRAPPPKGQGAVAAKQVTTLLNNCVSMYLAYDVLLTVAVRADVYL